MVRKFVCVGGVGLCVSVCECARAGGGGVLGEGAQPVLQFFNGSRAGLQRPACLQTGLGCRAQMSSALRAALWPVFCWLFCRSCHPGALPPPARPAGGQPRGEAAGGEGVEQRGEGNGEDAEPVLGGGGAALADGGKALPCWNPALAGLAVCSKPSMIGQLPRTPGRAAVDSGSASAARRRVS